MSIKLTPIKTRTPKDQYRVVVHFEHGDADSTSTEEFKAKDEADFISMMKAKKFAPMPEAEGGDDDKYEAWFENHFHGDLPHDVIFTDCRARVGCVEGFYYDANGVKFEASIE